MASASMETASDETIRPKSDASPEAGGAGIWAYAAPVMGSYFFYIPMWSILPGIYATYFGLTLTSVAGVLLSIRLFDGVSDLTVGYLSDRHRAAGGSRKPWVIVGGIGAIVACYFLFTPPAPTTTTYYLICSLAYFLAFAVSEIPHLTWGSELTLNYQVRARVYGARNVLSKVGISAFYALPLLPIFSSAAYTPDVLRVAVLVGAVVTVPGLMWALFGAPAGVPIQAVREDSVRLLLQSIVHNKPLLLYFAAVSCGALCYGMWFGLVYIYLDSYLRMGEQVAIIFLLATVASILTTPLWLKLIQRTSKATTWAVGVALFGCQLLGTLWIAPGDPWWMALLVVFLANLCFTANDVAAVSSMGDIVDYGKLKFGVDRGATYFAILNLLFKVSLGIGGGLALGIAGEFGFRTEDAIHSASAIWGLQLGFIVLPACCALVCLLLVLRTPIDRQRHRTIQRRLESRLLRSGA
ncbi:MFS transporter [Steroidobacter cummioxidans]|uniref:MFS transporter n=1 Tax=Steroidobacter cummioxidans TaxID=1803913 RepID=UPI000E31656D|nr:MFS transporter [Steroidobacter cummioxidans]